MMKRCPKCNRTYSDVSLNFCLDDGLRLDYLDDEFETFSPPKKKKTFRILVPLTAVLLLILAGGTAIGFYQFKDQIASLLNGGSGPGPTSSPFPFTSSAENNEEAISNLLKAVREAWVKNDIGAFDQIMAEEYEEEYSNGLRFNKRQLLAQPSVGKRISLKHHNVKIEIDGDEATATGKGVSTVDYLGVETALPFTFKSDFKKRGGRWQAVYTYVKVEQTY